MTDLDRARAAGRRAVQSVRRALAERVAELLGRDPDLMATAVETGLVRRDWLERPGSGLPISTATPLEVIERFLAREVERRPSLLAALGLTAIQVLSSPGEGGDEAGATARLAVAFTDLEGFTRWCARAGDEAAADLLATHHRIAGPIVRSRGGRIVKRMGDGLLCTFPEPEAAVLACLELVDAQPGPLRVRAGVHAGEVVVTAADVLGHTVNVAARVAESARGGQVLVTEPVAEAAADLPRVAVGRLRRRSYKGLEETVRVASVSSVAHV
jgi:adenylate cyclase